MRLTLVKKIKEAKDTVSFFFKPENPLSPLPGQYVNITLPKLDFPDEKGATRHFTIASSSTEGDQLQITTRIRKGSGFKQTLNGLSVGGVVECDEPHGLFVFDENSKNNVFLAGGIGIAPFRAMIKWNIDKKLNIPMYLIYSNSDSEFVFKNEFDVWQKESELLKIMYVNTSVMGHITSQMIEKFVIDWGLVSNRCTYWIVGPNTFVDAIEQILDKTQVPSTLIKTERFKY